MRPEKVAYSMIEVFSSITIIGGIILAITIML
jgi:hypothetical protein